MNIEQHISHYSRLILDTLPGETHKEKFDYLTKLMYDRDTYKSEIEAAENIARRVIEENKGLKSDLEDLKAENEHLYAVLRLCKDALYQHKFEHNHQDTAIIKRAESELSDLLNGGYTDKELNCKGCFGPCGRCEETDTVEIYGSEIAFSLKVPRDQLVEKCQEIWNHPENYSDYQYGSEEAYYNFIRLLWVKDRESEKRLADIVRNRPE